MSGAGHKAQSSCTAKDSQAPSLQSACRTAVSVLLLHRALCTPVGTAVSAAVHAASAEQSPQPTLLANTQKITSITSAWQMAYHTNTE